MRKFVLTALVVLVAGRAVSAETIEDVKKQIADHAAKHKTVQYKMTMKSETKMPQQSKSEMSGTYKFMKQGEKLLMRMESNIATEASGEGYSMKQQSKSTMVSDGEYMWTYTDGFMEMMGQKTPNKSVIKQKAKNETMSPLEGFENFEQKLLPTEKVDGKSAWVIEMTPKDPQMKMMMGKAVHWIDQATGLPLKVISYDAQGKESGLTTFSDHKIDEKISEDVFKFTPPDGVPVTDMTQGG